MQQERAQATAEQAQINKMQRAQKWVVTGDVLFPEGDYQLSANSKQTLNQYVPKQQSLQNAKLVVYGYTDNEPVGAGLQRAGIVNNIDLSSRRGRGAPEPSAARGDVGGRYSLILRKLNSGG